LPVTAIKLNFAFDFNAWVTVSSNCAPVDPDIARTVGILLFSVTVFNSFFLLSLRIKDKVSPLDFFVVEFKYLFEIGKDGIFISPLDGLFTAEYCAEECGLFQKDFIKFVSIP
jgi:hypothetical protein